MYLGKLSILCCCAVLSCGTCLIIQRLGRTYQSVSQSVLRLFCRNGISVIAIKRLVYVLAYTYSAPIIPHHHHHRHPAPRTFRECKRRHTTIIAKSDNTATSVLGLSARVFVRCIVLSVGSVALLSCICIPWWTYTIETECWDHIYNNIQLNKI